MRILGERCAAARLAKLHPDEAYQRELAMTVLQRRALYADLEKPEFRRLRADLGARECVDNLNRNVLAEALMEAQMAPQREIERAARRAARKAAQQ